MKPLEIAKDVYWLGVAVVVYDTMWHSTEMMAEGHYDRGP